MKLERKVLRKRWMGLVLESSKFNRWPKHHRRKKLGHRKGICPLKSLTWGRSKTEIVFHLTNPNIILQGKKSIVRKTNFNSKWIRLSSQTQLLFFQIRENQIIHLHCRHLQRITTKIWKWKSIFTKGFKGLKKIWKNNSVIFMRSESNHTCSFYGRTSLHTTFTLA